MNETRVLSPPAGLRETGPDVYYSDTPLMTVGAEYLAFLREAARLSPRRRARICMHQDPGDMVHEMLIVHHRTTYVRPHRHRLKSESLFALEGEAAAIFYDDDGGVRSTVELGPVRAGRTSYYRAPAGWWHSLLIRSEWFIFHEVVGGPFERSETEFPPWAPSGENQAEADAFRTALSQRVQP